MNYILHLDYQIFQAINSLSGRWRFLDWLGIVCAKYLIFIIFIILGVWWFKIAKTKRSKNWPVEGRKKWLIGGAVALPVVTSFLLNQLLALIKFRDRPCLNLNINQLVQPLSEKSFPSDHAAVAFALAVAVYFYNQKLGIFFLASATVISLARIYVGVHYPVDVLGGAVVGTVLAILVHHIFLKKYNFRRKNENYC